MRIYVIGHISPDLDSIVTAAAYTELLKGLNKYPETEIIATRAGEVNKETKFIFEKYEVDIPQTLEDLPIATEDKVILVDHNEASQRHKIIQDAQIVEILDHHKANLTLPNPIEINIQPLGSTSTLIFKLFETNNLVPNTKTAHLLLSAILSDTQGLKSSTTTNTDRDVTQRVAIDLGENIEALTFDLFKAKSDITDLATKDIVTKDCKVCEFNGTKVFINQIETVEPNKILDIEDNICQELETMKKELEVTYAFNMVTDILQMKSWIIYPTPEEKAIAERAFNTTGKEHIADIGPKTSRKKDIVPALDKALSTANQ